MYYTDHYEILHTLRQLHCRDVCKISLWYFEVKLQQSKFWSNFEFDRNTVSGTLARGLPYVANKPEWVTQTSACKLR